MASITGTAAQGIESGFGMGLRWDAANESKRRAGVMEENERKQSDRAEAELGLRTRAQERLEARQDQSMEIERGKTAIQFADAELKDLIAANAGGAATEDMVQRYGRAVKLKEAATNMISKWVSNQGDPKDVDPDTLYIGTTLASGRTPEDWQQVPTGVKDLTTGLQTKNGPLTLKGASVVLAPWLRRGIGETNEYGTITRKELVGLDPDPTRADYVIPRLRVYVNTPNGEKFYDAPMTRGGSASKEDDTVVGINMKRGFDYMGNADVLAKGLSEPEIAAKLAQASPEAKEQAKRWLDELNARGKASQPKVGATEEKIRAIQKFAVENNVSFDEAAKSIQAAGVTPGAPKPMNDLQAEEIKSRIKVNEARAGKLGGGGGGRGGSGKAAAPGAGVKSTALGGVEAPSDKDEAIDFWARAVIAGDRDWQVGIGRSKTGAQLIEAVKRRVPQLAKQMGLEPQDIGTTRAESAAFAATMKDLTKRSEAVELFASKVDKDMKTFDDLLDKAALSSPLLINKPINALRRQFSDPELAQLDLAAKQVGAEYERLITGGTLSVAQLHVGAAEDAKKLINGDMPPKQARAVMQTMRQEMANAKAAAHESEQRIKGRMQGLGRGRDAGAAAPAKPAAASGGGSPPVSALKEGQVTTFANGQKWTLKNGQPAKVQ